MRKAVFVFIFVLAVVECTGHVEFSRMEFTMTCPNVGDDGVTWTKPGTTITNSTKQITQEYSDTNKGKYHCTPKPEITGTNGYYFYVQGRVCENCYELDAMLLSTCIISDLLVTGCIIMVIYKVAQRKSSSARPPAPVPASSGRPARGSGPTVPNRDYEVLNPATRDTSTYAVAAMHRTG